MQHINRNIRQTKITQVSLHHRTSVCRLASRGLAVAQPLLTKCAGSSRSDYMFNKRSPSGSTSLAKRLSPLCPRGPSNLLSSQIAHNKYAGSHHSSVSIQTKSTPYSILQLRSNSTKPMQFKSLSGLSLLRISNATLSSPTTGLGLRFASSTSKRGRPSQGRNQKNDIPEQDKNIKDRTLSVHKETRQQKMKKKAEQERLRRKRLVKQTLDPADPLDQGEHYYNKSFQTDETKPSYGGDLRYPIMGYNFQETAQNPGAALHDINPKESEEEQIRLVKEDFQRRGDSLDMYAANMCLDDDTKTPKEKAEIIFELAKGTANDGFYDEALHYLKTVFLLNPAHIEALKTRGELNEKLERYEDAFSDYAILLSRDKSQRAFCVARLACLLSNQNQYLKAKSLIEWFKNTDENKEQNVEVEMISSHITNVLGDVDNLVQDASGFSDGYYDRIRKGQPIEVRMTEHGRALFATKDFKPGEIVFSDQPLITTPLFNPLQKHTCSYCYRPLVDVEWVENLNSSSLDDLKEHLSDSDMSQIEDAIREQEEIKKPDSEVNCNHCTGIVQYCSTLCREADKKTLHNLVCPGKAKNEALQKLLGSIREEGQGGEQSYFLLRLFARLEQERIGKFTGEPIWNDIKRLCYVPPSLDQEGSLGFVEKEHYKYLVQLFPKLVSSENYRRFRSVIHLNALTLATNGFGVFGKIEGGDLKVDYNLLDYECAAGLFPIASYLNHSCTANIALQYPLPALAPENPSVAFVAQAAISKDSELTYNYGSSYPDIRTRRAMLREKYFFDCNCEMCQAFKGDPSKKKKKGNFGLDQNEWDHWMELMKEDPKVKEKERIQTLRDQTKGFFGEIQSQQFGDEEELLKNSPE